MHDGHGASLPGDGEQDGASIDAEFAAMTEGLEVPEQVQADLQALDEHRAQEGAQAPESGEPQGSEGGVNVADLPRNTYRGPQGLTSQEGAQEDDGLTDEQRAEVAALAAALEAESPATDLPRAVKIALVLTPLSSAEALAALCQMSDLDCTVVPAASGAFAVKELVSAHAEWDLSELLGGQDSEPAEAGEMASVLSRLSRSGVILLTADLATDVGIETGLSGTISARRYQNQEAGEEASAGLVLSAVDQVVEDVLLGILRAQDVPGAVRSSEVKPGRAMRFLGRDLRRPRGGTD